ncbi:MAG: hypothetical protein WCL25_01700 [bacterium]
MSGGILIVGLINAKGELWISAFNRKDGALAWSTYIGVCSFLSPPCELSLTEEDNAYIATNHGVLVKLKTSNGELSWIRAYEPKKYSIFAFWENRRVARKSLIAYDNQFIEQGRDGLLYYKPRESDTIYLLEPESGKLSEEITVDAARYYTLRARDGEAIFLDKTADDKGNARVRVLDLFSGAEKKSITVKAGELQGVRYINSSQIAFKIADVVHLLTAQGDGVIHSEISVPVKGWLLAYDGEFLLVGDSRKIYRLDIDRTGGVLYTVQPSRHYGYLEKRKEIKKLLEKAAGAGTDSAQALESLTVLMIEAGEPRLSLDEVYSFTRDNLERLRHPACKGLLSLLGERYGREIINYNDIDISFNNFLIGMGLLDRSAKQDYAPSVGKNPARLPQGFSARGDRFFLLPVETLKGGAPKDFFLLLNRDQLLCIDEEGGVRWERKVFYRVYPTLNYKVSYRTDISSGRMYADDIKAYLYGDTLIINDRVNVIGINQRDGSYMWSFTNKDETFENEKHYPLDDPDNLYKQYGLRRSFLKNIMFYTEFIGERLIIVHGQRVYSVDPFSGFCERTNRLAMEGALKVSVSGRQLFILSCALDRLEVLDERLESKQNITLDFVSGKDIYPQLVFAKDGALALYVDPTLYLIDVKKGALKQRLEIGPLDRCYLESTLYNDLLVIAPFRKIIGYRLENGLLKPGWEFALAPETEGPIWQFSERKARRYWIVGKNIVVPLRKAGDYFFAAVDLETGKKFWETPVKGARGLFYDLSEYVPCRNTVSFVFTTGCDEFFREEFNFCRDAESVPIAPRLITIDMESGAIVRESTLPSLSAYGLTLRSNMTETDNLLVYCINAKSLITEKKKQ